MIRKCHKRAWMTLAALLAVAFLLGGCSKVNKENYEKLSFGMEYAAAVEILGDPDHCEDMFNTRSCTWGDDTKNISVKVVAGKIVFLQANGL
jgi:uncharacterized protein YceK